MGDLVDLQSFRKEQAELEELATLLAEQYEASYYDANGE